ncbi:MAG: amidotransferase [Acidobacteria bacterium]|nr:MAG: amidotransferase [Acidobacteriota bacterium]
MRVHFLQHVPFEGLGSIEPWIRANKYRLSATRFYDRHPLPNLDEIDWLIAMGGPMGVYDDRIHPWLSEEKRFIEEAIKKEKTILGVCLGAQLLADVLGARIFRNRYKEIGWFPVEKSRESCRSLIFSDLPDKFEAFHWHGDTFSLPKGAIRVASSAASLNQGFVYEGRVIALQFHLETTKESAELLLNNCTHELSEGPYVQSPGEILSPEARFAALNEKMRGLLTQLSRLSPHNP